MDLELLIRNARTEDFEVIYPLFQQLWPGRELHKEELRKVYERGVSSKTDELFCAELNGEIIGFCVYAIVNNLWQEGQIAYIYTMIVEEKLRGSGYGTRLLQEAIRKAKAQGLKRVELDSGFPRERAHRFYEKLGFEKRAYLFSYPL